MVKVKLSLAQKTVEEKISFSKKVVRAVKGNPYFHQKDLNIVTLEAAISRLERIYFGELLNDQMQLIELIEAESFLEDQLKIFANHIQRISRGNSIIISSTGFEWEKTTDNSKQIKWLRHSGSPQSDEIELRWRRVYGAKAYLIEFSTNPADPNSWKKLGHSLRSQYKCFKIKKNKSLYIRISVLGRDNKIITSKVQRLYAA